MRPRERRHAGGQSCGGRNVEIELGAEGQVLYFVSRTEFVIRFAQDFDPAKPDCYAQPFGDRVTGL